MTSKVFVSHSAKNKADSRCLDELVRDLEGAGLEPWVDRERIQVGAPWNAEITKGLQDCHAAVILFSKSALTSDFVKYEVSYLVFRKRTQPGFGLFPVIIDRTSIDTIEKGFFGSIQLDDFQLGRLDVKRAEILEKLKELDPHLKSPASEIEALLLPIVGQVSRDILRAAAKERGWELWTNVPLADAEALHFVRRLIAAPMAEQITALNRIKGALPPGQDIEALFQKIAPCWVHEEAARKLHAVRSREPGRRGAVVNGTLPNFTCEMFLKRARPTEDTGIEGAEVGGAHVPGGRNDGDDLVVQVRRALCQRYNLAERPDPDETDEELEREAEYDEGGGRRPVHVLQIDEAELFLLAELLDRFKRVTFVAMTGSQLPPLSPELGPRVTLVQPELVGEETPWHNESYAHEWYRRRQRLLGVRANG